VIERVAGRLSAEPEISAIGWTFVDREAAEI